MPCIPGGASVAIKVARSVCSFSNISSATLSPDTLLSTIETVAGIISDNAGTLLNVIDVAKEIASNPNITSKNYTNSQTEFLAQSGIEQAFAKDFSSALNQEGIANSLNYYTGTTVIANMTILATDPYFPSEQLADIAEQVKKSNPLYQNVEINY